MAPLDIKPANASRRTLIAEIASRQHLVVAVCILALLVMAWWWLWRAGPSTMNSMPEMATTTPSLAWTADYIASTFCMWTIMMVAMMLPSAAPMILLQDVFCRRNGLGGKATMAFAVGYFVLWTAFALMAALAQSAFISAGIVQRTSLAIGSGKVAAFLLFAAGLYELSPLKRLCLAHCQSPVIFLTRYWRPGIGGAVGLGLRHGAFCIGCCGALMLLLFVGGVMNLGWIALLALLVLAEKYAPPAWRLDKILACLLMLASLAIWFAAYSNG